MGLPLSRYRPTLTCLPTLPPSLLFTTARLFLFPALTSLLATWQLDLSDNMLTEEGALALVTSAAKASTSLRWLDLRLNPLITDEGRQLCAAASVGASFDLKL